jgi:hypothetical protein
MASLYRPPLAIYIIWHPRFAQGQALADGLFQRFCRDASRPLERGLGIPVFFRSAAAQDSDRPAPIDLDAAKHIVVLPLIEDEMVVDAAYSGYLTALADRCIDPTQPHRMISIGLSKNAIQVEKVRKINLLMLSALPVAAPPMDEAAWLTTQLQNLHRKLAGELVRILSNFETNAQDLGGGIYQSAAAMKIFLSYARRDGLANVEAIQALIKGETTMSVFFDSLSISLGYDFGSEIEAGIKTSVLVVFLTDVYASREWCRREVLIAKRLRRPILVVNALSAGEQRAFPYLGNAPTLRWNGEPQALIDAAVLEALRFFYSEQLLKALGTYFSELGLLPPGTHTLPNPPEILTLSLLGLAQGEKTLLYPDPPLSSEELEVLSGLNPHLRLITPNWVLGSQGQNDLQSSLRGKKIAISISQSDSLDLRQRGFGGMHQQDNLVEFLRHIFSAGAGVIYAGNLDPGSFTEALLSLANESRREGQEAPLLSYMSWPYSEVQTTQLRAEFMGAVDFKAVPPNPVLPINPELSRAEFGSVEQLATALSLCEMRALMAAREDARILMGGRIKGSIGFFPGLLEEAWRTMKAGKPLFLLGAWGGCTKAICDMLLSGVIPEEFTDAFYNALPAKQGLRASRVVWSPQIPALADLPSGPEQMARELLAAGIPGLNNGLSGAENLLLWETPFVHEAVALVLKGLSQP